METKPSIFTLCGSTKFKDDFIRVEEELTLKGNIVLTVGLFGHADNKYDTVIDDKTKAELDELHKRKIDISDAIYVINRDGYIGESTRNEIEYAKSKCKIIVYMEDPTRKPNYFEEKPKYFELNALIKRFSETYPDLYISTKTVIEFLKSLDGIDGCYCRECEYHKRFILDSEYCFCDKQKCSKLLDDFCPIGIKKKYRE